MEKVSNTIEFCIFELVSVPDFSSTDSFDFFLFFFYQICPKKVFPVEKGKIALLCVRPWSLLTVISFSVRGPTDTSVFFSRRDNKSIYSKLYITILLTLCSNVSMKNVIKRVKSVKLLNVKLLNLPLTVVGILNFSITLLITVCRND